MGIATLVLLIACANLTHLMMARANARHQEIVVRLALGASGSRLIRQLLAESALIALMGAALGVGLAQILSRVTVAYLSTQQTQWFLDLTPDWRVLAFVAGMSVLICFAFGLTPAINASRSCPGDVMKAGGRRVTIGRDRLRFRQGLVVSQVALSLVLLMGAVLFVRTLRNLVSVNTGFQRDSLLITDVDLSPLQLSEASRVEYKQELLARIRSIPGVVAAAQVSHIPVSGNGWNENITIPGSQVQREIANFDQVSAGYFHTMGIAQLLGRDFSESDTAASTPVAIVTHKFAQKFLGGADPTGRTIQISDSQTQVIRTLQIVGMVNDVKYTDLREEFTPIVFVAETQDLHPYLGTRLIIRSSVGMSEITSSVRQTLAQINPKIVITFDQFHNMVEQSLLRERLMASLAGCFGMLAAILSMAGLYGMISYMVARRKNEFGIRVALGANRRDIIAMILREAGTLLGIGLLVGIALTFLASESARTFLYGLKPNDPSTFVVAMLLLVLTALAAAVIPARRAATLDPMQALREE